MNLKTKSALFLVPTILLSLNAWAIPHHRMMSSIIPKVASNCTFPDGTSPKRPDAHCYNPTQFLKAYGIDKLHAMGITGKGQTIILADSFGSPTMQQDLDHFSDVYHLPHTKIQFIYPNGTYVNDLSTDEKEGWAGETTLDLEWAHAIAPDATLVNIITDNAETVGLEGFPDLFAGIETATQQYPGSIISMSFGTGEPTFTDADVANYLKGSFHQILQAATSADITLLASSGDSGSTNLNATQDSLIATPNASYPASDPLITAVGGTALEYGWRWTPQGTANDYWTCKIAGTTNCPQNFLASVSSSVPLETVWNEQWAEAAGGSGVSSIFTAPDYQSQINPGAKKIANGQRVIPDVSLNAAINGGVNIYTSYGKNGPSWQSTGGTSCAAPETAALVALAGQKASDTLGKRVGIGFLNPIVYSLKDSDFNDVTSHTLGSKKQVSISDNALFFSPDLLAALGPKSVPPVAVPGYMTTAGYDLSTGRGSPKAVQFVLDVAKARVNRTATVQLP